LMRSYAAVAPERLPLRYDYAVFEGSGGLTIRSCTFGELPLHIQGDLRTYFGQPSRLFIYGRDSTVYDRRLSNKFVRWFGRSAKFRIVFDPSCLDWYWVRLAASWMALVSGVWLCVGIMLRATARWAGKSRLFPRITRPCNSSLVRH
jgi:hypothetical protein